MIVAKSALAFGIGLAVSLLSQRYTASYVARMKTATVADSNKFRLVLLGSQVLTVLVLFLFRNSVQTLVAAGIGLLLPKNILMVRHLIGRGRWGGRS